MRDFFWILKHYLKKNFLSPSNLLLIGLPLVFALAFYLLDNYLFEMMERDLNIFYGIIMPLVLVFQFFGADLTADWLHTDMKGSTRARLLASPVSPRVFYAGVMVAAWLFNVFMSSIVVAVTAVAFDVQWGNYAWVLVVLLCLSLITQLVGLLIFYFTKDQKSGTRMSYVFGEIMIAITLFPIMFINPANINDSVITLINHLPANLGLSIIAQDDLPYNLAVLLGISAVVATIAFIAGRQRNDNL